MHIRFIAVLMRAVPVAALSFTALSPVAFTQADQPMPNPPEFPFENPDLPGQGTLGKLLFWDEQLSFDNTMACGTCHIHESGGSDPRSFNTPNPGPDMLFNTADDIRGSAGVVRGDANGNFKSGDLFFPNVGVTGRKSPSAINALYFNDIFWDGRATSAYTDPQTALVEIAYMGALESQAKGPPTSDVEMSREARTWDDICAKLPLVKPMALATNLPAEMSDFLAQYPTYPQMFEAVYGDPTITSRAIMFAIGNYERTLIADESPIDDLLKGNITELPPDLQPGFLLFQGKANCATCHVLPFTSDGDFHNIAVRPDSEDIGRMAVTGDPADLAKFKTPNIRNASLRLPLFHNGSMDTMEELVDFYEMGGLFTGPNTDISIVPLVLTAQEKADLVQFLNVATLDARVVNNEFPFSRPTLRSELPPTNVEFGIASVSGTNVAPSLISHVPANQGHPDWLMGVTDAKASAMAILALAYAPGDGSPFPDPRYPIPMNINVGTLISMQPTLTDAFGVATTQLGIPINSALAGYTFYAQYFIADATALATGGVYGSKGVAVTIF